MSLQLAAQHLASKGRGPDTMLVHMAPSEVKSLQAVAMAHGGSLTLNPDTGLPEAGFLSSILPMIAGVGLTAMSGGALSPMMAGLITGGVTGAATGSLKKGLMAGLGAYGGAGLGGALAGVGATQAGNAAAAELASTNADLMSQLGEGANAKDILMARGAQSAGPAMQALNANPVQMSMTDKMMAGVKGLGSEAGRDAFMQNIGGAQGLFKSGAAALSPLMMAQAGESAQRPSTGTPYQFAFDAGATGAGPSRDSSENVHFRPRLQRMAEGGDTGMTGQSDDYYRYLMGLAPAPRPYTPAPVVAPAATQADTAPLTVTNPMAARRYDTYSDSMSPDDPNNPQNPNAWGNLTPLEQAQFYSMHPGLAKTTTTLIEGFGRTIPGMIQNYFAPNFVQQQKDIANGNLLKEYMQQYDYFGNPMAPSVLSTMSPQDQANINAQGAHSEGQVDTDSVGGYGAQGETAPGGASFGSDIGYDTGVNDSGPTSAGDYARGGLSSLAAFAQGGYNLGDYSDGGRLLRGPGDGVSDSIPASIANKRPARLADGEFVVPARIVSELGNGSTEAGARKLYAMMDRVQKNRAKTTGKGKVAVNSRSEKYLPA